MTIEHCEGCGISISQGGIVCDTCFEELIEQAVEEEDEDNG